MAFPLAIDLVDLKSMVDPGSRLELAYSSRTQNAAGFININGQTPQKYVWPGCETLYPKNDSVRRV